MVKNRNCQEQRDDQKWLYELQKLLEEYDRIFLIPEESGLEKYTVAHMLKIGVRKNKMDGILIFSSKEEYGDLGFAFKKITREFQNNLYQLYHMYEFSERFQLISKGKNIGGLWNLVDTDLLSWDEMTEALFI